MAKPEHKMKMNGFELIALERKRQMRAESYSPEHDDMHDRGELAEAAFCYLTFAHSLAGGHKWSRDAFFHTNVRDVQWPFDQPSFKPSDDPMRNLEKAGALIAAEIDRLMRAKYGA